MKGSIHFRKNRGIWRVSWYHKPDKKTYYIYRYKGEIIYHKNIAVKLLATMQADYENGTFNIEKYTGKQWTDVIPYLHQWYGVVKDDLAPATAKCYKSYIKNHLEPFFKSCPVQLHEIQYDVLMQLLGWLKLSGKGKANVMYCLHACLDYAWRSRRIQAVPPFPQKKYYQLQEPAIRWLPEERQLHILEQIPDEHKPIFYFLKYHLRRPSEAMALYKEDFQDGVFIIRRAISARKLIDRTKTKQIHIAPCHKAFLPFIEQMRKSKFQPLSQFFFTARSSRLKGYRYTDTIMARIWKEACEKAGEDIDMYSGLKHSSCSQYINEKGLNESELQIITGHARLDSVKRYAKTEIARKLELMEGRVVKLKNVAQTQPKSKNDEN